MLKLDRLQINDGTICASVPGRSETRSAPRALDRLVRQWLIIAILPCAIVALGVHEFAARRQARRSQDAAVQLLAHAVASQWRGNDSLTAGDLQRACQRLTGQPAILAAAVFNPLGERLAQSARNNDLLPLLAIDRGPIASSDIPATLTAPATIAREFPLIQHTAIDLGPQFNQNRPIRLAILVGAVDPGGVGFRRWWMIASVLGAAAAGLYLADRALERRIVEPVTRLLASVSPRGPNSEAGDDKKVADEFEMLARSFSELKEEAFHWRGQAERVERRMTLQIASHTREISRDLRRFQREAWLDPLTRLKNRRLLDEQLPTIFAAHEDAGLDFSLVMIDLDHFKRLNDEHGHQAGDEVLIFVGELLRQCLRTDDVAVRYGGDEFVLILPGVSADDAAVLTERLMALFAQRVKVMFDGRALPGMTAGIASLQNNRPAKPNDLLAAADAALYLAKKSGRGRVEISRSLKRLTA